MSDTSVGVISLDLVIKEKLSSQLEDIKKRISGGLSKPVDDAMNSMKESVESCAENLKKPIKKIKDDVQDAFSFEAQRAEVLKMAKDTTAYLSKQHEDINKEFSEPFQIDIAVPDMSSAAEKISEPLTQAVEKTEEKIKETIGNYEIPTDPIERMQMQLENTREKLDLLQKKWQELQETLENTEGDSEAQKVISQLNSVEKQMLSLQNTADKTKQKIEQSSGADKLTQTVQAYEAKIQGIEQRYAAKIEQINSKTAATKEKFEQQMTSMKEQNSVKIAAIEEQNAEKIKGLQERNEALLSKLTAKRAESIKNKLGGAFKTLKSVGGKAVNTLRNKFSGLKSTVNGMNKPFSKLGNSIKRALKATFLMAGVYAAFRGIKSALTSACESNEDFAKSLNEVKANLNIAFTPIMNAVMPAINTLMSGLAAVTKQLAAFTSELFGSTYQKSLDTLKQIKSVSKEASKSSTYLNSFDEMNVAQDTSSDSSDSSDSSVDYSAISGDDVTLPDWAQRMKDAIKSGDWSGVGSLLAEKVNGIFDKINWDNIRKKINSAVKSVTDGLNGFVGGINWDTLGKTFGEGINTVFGAMDTFLTGFDFEGFGRDIGTALNSAVSKADWKLIGKTLADRWNALIDTLYGFVTTFDFSDFGKSISDSVNSWFDSIDWAKLGTTVSESLKGLLDTVIAFLENTDWQGIGEKLWTCVKNIDWSGIATRLFEAIGAAIGGAVGTLWGFIKEAVYSIRDYFTEKIKECGGSVGKGLIKGILDGIKNIGTWIKNHIFKPFIKGFKKAFGIASPSKEMKTMGGYIIDGLYEAISSGIEKIKKIFSKMLTAIKNVFLNIGSWFKKKFSSAWDNIKSAFSSVGTFFSKLWGKIKSPFATVGSWFKKKFSAAWDKIKEVFDPETVSKAFSKVVRKIKSAFSSIPKWFRDKFSEAWENVRNVFSKGGKIFSGIKEGIAETFKSVVNKIIDGINTVISTPFEKINGMLNKIHNISIMGAKPFSGLWDTDPLPVPQIPKLANGGLAAAPTLAMVGDNKNAKVDPEVISPLSKLKELLDQSSTNAEITELLKEIAELLRQRQSVSVWLSTRRGTKLLSQEVIDDINDIINSTGKVPINI